MYKIAAMVNNVTKDTTLCISLAARPSNHGVRFHNWLYAELGLDFLYKAVSPIDIKSAIAGIRGLGIRGAGVSMPFKAEVIPLIDSLDSSAARIGSVNTIVNDAGKLSGFNTDYLAVRQLLETHQVAPTLRVAIKGSGGMSNAVVAAFSDHGMIGTVVARNRQTGRPLADRYGWDYAEQTPADAQLLVNVTPLGMNGPDSDVVSFTAAEISRAELVFDCVAYPILTPLITAARELGKQTINGGEVVALQAAEQFYLYTGVRPSAQQISAAEEFAQH